MRTCRSIRGATTALRPPRPDLTVAIGTPNACNACHRDRDARWAAGRVKALWGDNPDRLHRYASAFAAADDGATDASAALSAVVAADDQPAIARASALARLDPNRGSANLEAIANAAQGLTHLPRDAALHHALGLSLVRAKRSQEALAELAQATKLDPANAHFAYVLGVAQHSFGDAKAAIATLGAASRAHPADREIVEALVSFHREAGDRVEAERYADRLRALGP